MNPVPKKKKIFLVPCTIVKKKKKYTDILLILFENYIFTVFTPHIRMKILILKKKRKKKEKKN